MGLRERDLISLLIIFTEDFMETLAHFLKFFMEIRSFQLKLE